MRRRLGADPLSVDRLAVTADDEIVDPVFEVAFDVHPEQAPPIGFVLAEQQGRVAVEHHLHRRVMQVRQINTPAGAAAELRLFAPGLP